MKNLFFFFFLSLLFIACNKSEHNDAIQELSDSLENSEGTQAQGENDLSFRGEGVPADCNCECTLWVENLGAYETKFNIYYVESNSNGLFCHHEAGQVLAPPNQNSIQTFEDIFFLHCDQTNITCSSGMTLNGNEIVLGDVEVVNGNSTDDCYELKVSFTCGGQNGLDLIKKIIRKEETSGSNLFKVISNDVTHECLVSDWDGCFPPTPCDDC